MMSVTPVDIDYNNRVSQKGLKINFYSTFRESAGVKAHHLPLTGAVSVRWVITEILREFPGLERMWLDKNGDLYGHVHIGLNQVDVMALPDQLDSLVTDVDTLDFFPPITGG